jgi:hypothetical protein
MHVANQLAAAPPDRSRPRPGRVEVAQMPANTRGFTALTRLRVGSTTASALRRAASWPHGGAAPPVAAAVARPPADRGGAERSPDLAAEALAVL